MLDAAFFKELRQSGVWPIFPILALYCTAITLVIPHLPTLLTNDFASLRAGYSIRCEDYHTQEPEACRDAHSDVVACASGASFISNTVVSLFMMPLIGRWSDHVGRRPFLLASALSSAATLSVVWFHLKIPGLHLFWYYIAQVLFSGFSGVPITLALLADALSPRSRSVAFGTALAMFAIGVVAGPSIGSRLLPDRAALLGLAGIAMSIVSGAALLPERTGTQSSRLPTSTSLQSLSPRGAVKILTRSRLYIALTVCTMLTGMCAEGVQDLLVQYLQLKLGFGPADQANVFVVVGVGWFVVQAFFLQPMLRMLGEKSLLLVGLAAGVVSNLVLAVAATGRQALATIGLGTLGSVMLPILTSLKSNHAGEDEQGAVQGALLAARAVAAGTGPILFSALFTAFTRADSSLPFFPGAPFILASTLLALAIIAALHIPVSANLVPVPSSDDCEAAMTDHDVTTAEHAPLPAEAVPLLHH